MATRKHSNTDDQSGKSKAEKEQHRRDQADTNRRQKAYKSTQKARDFKNNPPKGPSV